MTDRRYSGGINKVVVCAASCSSAGFEPTIGLSMLVRMQRALLEPRAPEVPIPGGQLGSGSPRIENVTLVHTDVDFEPVTDEVTFLIRLSPH